MDLRERLAQKMLENKLNILPIEDAYKLYKQGIVLKTESHYVVSVEKFKEWNYQGDETDFYIKEILNRYSSLEEAEGRLIEVGDSYDHFDEFTYGLFPAPTYMELIK